ncbi:Calpain-7 [Blattella germanica]|nr:Calpain-7 [Blattella germanica]
MSWNIQGLVEDALTSSTRAIYFDREDLAKAAATQDMNQPSQKQIQKFYFLFNQAMDADEAGNIEEAVELYLQAAELRNSAKSETTDEKLQNKLQTLARHAVDRVEDLKGLPHHVEEKSTYVPVEPKLSPVPEDSTSSKPQLHRGSSAHLKVSGQDTYTEEEKRVLLQTSHINRKEYVPFMSVDLGERFQLSIPFTDKEGRLALAPKQQRDFSRWARPDEICPEPKMVIGQHVDCFSIKQTVVSDCSFVASLAVSALYERRFGRRLVTSIIYPQNSKKQPVYNPFGKYMVKLHINGVPRKVIIDDLLPVGRHGELLCSYSTNRGELWISLLEKAYMKVMGGYDFPGSNSNIDLHALTGWIPERMAIRLNEPDFNADALFEKLHSRLRKGDVLVTVATGEMSDAEADRTGLVPTHAYAVLNVEKINVKSWSAGVGPVKDAYNIGENPQFRLELESGATGAVWILLTRHITQIEDFKENREYITVLVYKNDGRRVYYPNDPPPFIDGVRINSPHYLSGGCGNHPTTYHNNPRYQMKLESYHTNNQILLDLKGPKKYQIGLDVICVIANDPNAPGAFKKKNSGAFRSGFVVLQLDDVPAGTYDIVPSTFLPNQEGPFILTIKSSSPITVARLQ